MAAEEADWIKAQKKAFTRWANVYLRMKKRRIDDLYTAFDDGINLITLLEVIGGEDPFPKKYKKEPKMRIHKLENTKTAFDYMKARGLELFNVGANDVCDGNGKIILAMMWIIISKFQVSDIMLDGVSGKDGLLLWVQRQTAPYADKGVSVNNFASDWQDGRAFCALLHKFRPQAFDFDALDPEDRMGNVALAFKVAEEWFGVEPLFDPEDVVEVRRPDEKIVICYISFLFRAIAEMAKQDALAKSIHKALDLTRRHDEWIEQYTRESAAVAEWLAASTETYSQPASGNNLAEIKASLDAFYTYKREAKPVWRSKTTAADGLLLTLRTSQRNNHRPEFEPPAATSPAGLEASWSALEAAEDAYEGRVRERYAAFEVLTETLARVHAKAEKIMVWVGKQNETFAAGDYGTSWQSVETLLEAHKAHQDQALHQRATLEALRGWTSTADMEEHSDKPAAVARLDEVAAALDEMTAAGDAHQAALQASLEKFRELDAKIKEYNKLATAFQFACDELEDEISMPIPATSEASVQALIDAHNSTTTAKKAELDSKLAGLKEIADELLAADARDAFTHNPLEAQVAALDALAEKIAARGAALATALEAEQAKEALRVDFAEKAQALKKFCQAQQDAVGALTGALEEQLATVTRFQTEHREGEEAHLGPVDAAAAALEAQGVVNNEHTSETKHSLRALWESLGQIYDQAADSLRGQIMSEKSGELTAEQVKEIREVFEFFDQDKDDALNKKEFHSCATGIGMILTEEELDAAFAEIDADGSGSIDMEEFSEFMIRRMQEPGHDRDQVAESFRELAKECPDDGCITEAMIKRFFLDEEDQAYLLERMPVGGSGGEGARDFESFVTEQFTR